MIKNFNELLEEAKSGTPKILSVAVAEDEAILTSVKLAVDLGLVKVKLFGDQKKIGAIADKIHFQDYEVINSASDDEAVKLAVESIVDKKADILMKGFVNTSIYMKAILSNKSVMESGAFLSMLAVYELSNYHKLIYCSDSGINVAPDCQQKKVIMSNALIAMKKLGIKQPKVALLTANEMVHPKIQSTVDAKALVEMVSEGELPECIAEGPIAFDVAFDKEAAEHKGLKSDISGDVDFILAPNIETGNVLGKSWLTFSKAKWAGIVLGARMPIILPSRSDTPEIKINSIALACLLSTLKEE